MITSLFCTLFLLQYFRSSRKYSYCYIAIMAGYLVGLTFTFHRMSLVVVVLVLILWMILNKRVKIMGAFALLILLNIPTLAYFMPRLYSDIWLVKSETQSQPFAQDQGLEIERQAFHGRGWLWMHYIKKYGEASFLEKIFGVHLVGRATHNDYLRVLFSFGLIGLILHLSLMFLVGVYLIYIYRRSKDSGDVFLSQLALTGLFFGVLFVLGSITLNVGVLSTLTWYFWMVAGMGIYQWKISPLPAKGRLALDRTGIRKVFLPGAAGIAAPGKSSPA